MLLTVNGQLPIGEKHPNGAKKFHEKIHDTTHVIFYQWITGKCGGDTRSFAISMLI